MSDSDGPARESLQRVITNLLQTRGIRLPADRGGAELVRMATIHNQTTLAQPQAEPSP